MNVFWRWMVENRFVEPRPSPFEALKVPTQLEPDGRAFTLEEVGRLVYAAHLDETDTQAVCDATGEPIMRSTAYWVASALALRLCELQRLTWADIRLSASRPSVCIRAMQGTKRRRTMNYLIDGSLASALASQRARTGGEDGDHCWPYITSADLKTRNAKKRRAERVLGIDAEAARVGIGDEMGFRVGWHAFRRGLVSELEDSGVPIKVAQSILGHSRPETTTRHYAKVSQRKVDERQVHVAGRVAESLPREMTGKSCGRLDGGGEISDTGDGVSDHHDPVNERGPPQSPPDTPIAGGAGARSFPRGGFGRVHGEVSGDTLGVTGSSPVSPIGTREAGILRHAAAILNLAADTIDSAPGRGHDVGRTD